MVDTFAAVEVAINNPRWDGVPFYLRTGKALAETRLTVTMDFRRCALQISDPDSDAANALRPNETVFESAEPGSVSVMVSAKKAEPQMTLEPASWSFAYADSFTVANEFEAHERLLHDVILGDQCGRDRAALGGGRTAAPVATLPTALRPGLVGTRAGRPALRPPSLARARSTGHWPMRSLQLRLQHVAKATANVR